MLSTSSDMPSASLCFQHFGLISDNVLQPVYEALFGFHVFGLGFVTSMGFIIGTGKSAVSVLSRLQDPLVSRAFPLHCIET